MNVPGWRNWQTRRTQNPVLVREWEFDPPSGHHQFTAWKQDWRGVLSVQVVVGLCANLNQIKHADPPVDRSEWVAYSSYLVR
jgi:hypothetical protein